MKTITSAVFVFLLAGVFAAQTAAPDVLAVAAEYERVAAIPLWPGFRPATVPLAVFDGKQTWLFRHPQPPPEYRESQQHKGAWVREGRDPRVQANTSALVGGVRTATAMLPGGQQPPRALAALMIHEAFHVFQRERHGDWAANEAELFTYPVEEADLLAWRRLEDEALRRALAGKTRAETACWAATASEYRGKRFSVLPRGAMEYETHSELNEGLASYVEWKANGRPAIALPDFGAEDIRQRAYATGRALAALLDRVAPGWQEKLETGDVRSSPRSGLLDELLSRSLPRSDRSCSLAPEEVEGAHTRAYADVGQIQTRRQQVLRDFLAAPGWKVVIAARSEPLQLASFDPLNVQRIDNARVLHTRMLQLQNAASHIEVLGRSALSEAAGAHPLFSGVRRLTLTGLSAEPVVRESGGKTVVEGDGFKAEFSSVRMQRGNKELLLEVGK